MDMDEERKKGLECIDPIAPPPKEDAATPTITTSTITTDKKDESDKDKDKEKEKDDDGKAKDKDVASKMQSRDVLEDEVFMKSLQQLPFYHGFLPREDLRVLLVNDGDYLIRVSEISTQTKREEKEKIMIKRDLILSVFEKPLFQPTTGPMEERAMDPAKDLKSEKVFDGKLRNMVVRRHNGKFGIEQHISFDTIPELLAHYNQSNSGETKKNRILKNAIKFQSWEYYHTDIKLGNLLGEGAYGEVRSGVLKRKEKNVDVAVKLMKGGGDMNKNKIREMMKEARLMRGFKHKNVVRFYGVAVDEQPLYILLELVKGGALNTYLQKNKKVSTIDLMNMCLGAACGLQYLHANNCIHRDIAARNCLYSVDRVVKLSDFGLSRIGNQYKLANAQKLPIKWLAAETICTLYFTSKTDVYSYGVMCFEIFSEGDEPWENITNTEAKKNVVTGKHLTIPDSCPEKWRTYLYDNVYVKEPKKRATMDDIVRYLEPLIAQCQEEKDKSSDKVKKNESKVPDRSAKKTKRRDKKKDKKKESHPGNHNM